MSNEEIPEFKFIEKNGLKIKSPKKIYESIFKLLKTSKTSNYEVQLGKLFQKEDKNRPYLVILLDELDFFITRNNSLILYNFFEWASNNKSKLFVIGIANTLDLTEAHEKVSSRVMKRLPFKIYDKEMLKKIISSRIGSLGEIFDPSAINLVADVVASYSGESNSIFYLDSFSPLFL